MNEQSPMMTLFGEDLKETFTPNEKEAVWAAELDFAYSPSESPFPIITSSRSAFIFTKMHGKLTAVRSDGKTPTKTKTGKMKKQKKYTLDLFKDILPAIDRKDRNFFDTLSEQEKKGFIPFTLNRWLSSVIYDAPELMEWWLRATNERFNKHLLNLKFADDKHFKLQWLMATTASPGMGKMRHQWIGYKKKGKGLTIEVRSFLHGLYPSCSDDEIVLLLSINDRATIRTLAKESGIDDKQIKKFF